ncbi:methyl-accepting chemotaxis protein [Marinospirillum celere]|uniref:Methyl-accepting chemotaxis protein n=1 Tax=Marinospirillum celere TaxID=1122252 RepID=A0A1I1GCN6_9GAMM|nr:methyl-accepting chemotaxis protein [Marinospirillum celere]SFC06890.1 methyl-accepting chemotaxis protein [Marinospirillum celere]
MSLYRSIEKTFWHTLTRKIVGNVSVLLLPQATLVILASIYLQRLESDLDPASLSSSIQATLDHFWWLLGISSLVAIGLAVFTVFFMRVLIVKPIKEITQVLQAIKSKNGDISATLPDYTYDEISVMARSYNEFSGQLKQMINEARHHSVKVALSAARLQKIIAQAADSSTRQEEQAQQILESSQQATQAVEEIASNTTHISEQTTNNLGEIHHSSQELQGVLQQIKDVDQLVKGFQKTVATLSQNSTNIREILNLVEDFSEQTNLLALNASIEAARAGDAGRGFAVVADEVRSLAHKVSEATQQIHTNITQMSSLVVETEQGADSIRSNVEETENFMGKTNDQFISLVAGFEQMSQQLTTISAAIDELSYTNRETHEHVGAITELSVAVKNDMKTSREHSFELELATESTQELLSRFIIGFGGFEKMTQLGYQWARQTQDALAAFQAQGLNLFDQDYQRINPDQQPAQYLTNYTKKIESTLQPLFDSFIAAHPEFIYAVAVDRNGYLPVHHKKVSQPITGDFSVDNAKSRNRRIFFDTRPEQRRCTHDNPFLLQTFIRDTGEILNDLSIPLYIDGKRWGSLIMGFETQHLLDEINQAD